ncbi:MAG: tRNA (N(6)-L-threonylcarbamoyladenosine(37)-C(2))-methylthiotransferase [Methanolinea sp.]|nr:tRNA (N(6)-L-threonylcarbamoyladenosine(37)-C(2))-methylthiotransferase [Methanolinea sp.]
MTTGSPLFSLQKKRVYIRTFGCTYNAGDSRKLASVLEAQGCVLVADPAGADAIVVNTCTVVGPTQIKVLRELRELQGYTRAPLYVTGCMPLVQESDIREVCTPVFIHSSEIHEAYRRVTRVPAGPVGIVQACQGCLGECTYCITRLARGRLVSMSREEVVSETERLVQAGAVEVQLTGQDVSAWGRDRQETLGDLLRALDSLGGRFMVRAGMMNPATLHPIAGEVAAAFRLQKVFSSLHLPVQSGSAGILARMKRGYTPTDVETIVETFSRAVPGFSLTTDVICGYPGESEEDFLATLDLLERIAPDRVNITRYSPRPGTPASREKDMPDRIKKGRSRRLREFAEGIAREKNAPWIGRVVSVLVTEHPRPGSSMARTKDYRGVVLQGNYAPGTVLSVRLLDDRIYYFTGEPV